MSTRILKLTISVLIVCLIKNGVPLQCYKCISMQQDSCYYGTKTLPTLKCMTKSAVCVFYQFEVQSRLGGSSLRTLRGCQSAQNGSDICASLMRQVKTTQGDIERGIFCHSCNNTLCNDGSHFQLTLPIPLLLIVALRIA